MIKVQNFEERLERDLLKLSVGMKEQQRLPESKGLEERVLMKRSLEAISRNETPPYSPPNSSSPMSSHQHTSISPLPSYLTSASPSEEVKREVERLVDLVFHKGLIYAIRESKRHPPFVEDAFHDALTDKLLPELKKRKWI